MTFTEQELTTTLAALRLLQDHPDPEGAFPEHFCYVECLDDDAIDDLCERLCCDPLPGETA